MKIKIAICIVLIGILIVGCQGQSFQEKQSHTTNAVDTPSVEVEQAKEPVLETQEIEQVETSNPPSFPEDTK